MDKNKSRNEPYENAKKIQKQLHLKLIIEHKLNQPGILVITFI